MRRIGLVTSARSDMGCYLPLMRELATRRDLELEIAATGTHLAPGFGLTVEEIEAAGFKVHHKLESLLSSDTPQGIGKSIGIGIIGFAQLFEKWRPDIVVVHGDRFDMLPTVLAALPYRIPIAHISGGDITEGAVDDSIRHAITKLSHLHFVEAELHRRRVLQMGEEPWRVKVCGALTLDNIRQIKLMDETEFEHSFGIKPGERFLLVTFHAVTLEPEHIAEHVAELVAALDQTGMSCVFTYPSADTGSQQIISAINSYCGRNSGCRLVVSAGYRGYLSLMARAVAMVGNSSSGIVEGASFNLAAVNIGDRQRGRIRPPNVIDCAPARTAILTAVQKAISTEFRESFKGLRNPYGDGHAAGRVVQTLAEVEISPRLIWKRFQEI